MTQLMPINIGSSEFIIVFYGENDKGPISKNQKNIVEN